MNRPTAVIADDEQNLRTSLRIMLQNIWPELHICGEAEDGEEAIDLIEREKPDVIFLDIKMPETTGLEVAKKATKKQTVVFVTAYDQYAVEAFENEAIDYVLKPVTEERLGKTVARLKRKVKFLSQESNLDIKMDKIIQVIENKGPVEKLRIIQVKSGTELQFIPVYLVCFFKAEYKYTTVQTAQKEFIIKTPIKELEERLDADLFWRIHRSTIVNIEKINKIKRSVTNRMVVTFSDTEKTVKVSKAYQHLFRHM